MKFIKDRFWIIVLVVVIFGYNVYTGVNNKSKWPKEAKEAPIESCLKDSRNQGEKHPVLTKEYCECSVQNIQAQYEYNEFVEISGQSSEIVSTKLLPSFEKCFPEYQRAIIEVTKE
ncbi:hypothetical protein [Flagellimonas myxillae]|uniref:hypothetical protein n=1 Tax=Flagellimonas myxillae TaxID=2942214 RepID=UPI00201FA3FD|nr:hypothetical protein [Muricauda myxillae]MCL6267651.1 hypothetical protein [Muricauda myxillae]